VKPISRRRFLGYGLGASAAMAGGGLVGSTFAAINGKDVSRTTGRLRKPVPSTCMQCYARCGILGFVEYGRLVAVNGNPDHPNNRGRLCAKGQAGVQHLYNPDRLTVPLKRTGTRGGGAFKEIGWDEALAEVAGRLADMRGKGKAHALVIHGDRDLCTAAFVRRFAHAYGTPNCFNHAALGGASKAQALLDAAGADVDVGDVARTQYILAFGSNPYEAHILRTSFAQRIAEGRTERVFGGRAHNVAKMVVFDVRLSQTAGRADEWIPIKPGTDGLVALALCHVILAEDLHDREFLRRWTNVSEAELRAHLAPYTPQAAEAVSGVPETTIRRIAIEFASTPSSTTLSAGGANKHYNGTQAERAILLLNALTGNIEKPGGLCFARTHPLEDPADGPPVPAMKSPLEGPIAGAPMAFEATHDVLPAIARGALEVGMYLSYGHNPVHAAPESRNMAKVLEDPSKVPFHVAVDSLMTESAMLADLVLPETTYLERWGLESPPALEMVPMVALRQPVVKPVGQSRSFPDVLLELSRRIGGGMERYFDFGTYENYLDKVVASVPRLIDAGGMDYLIENGFWVDPDAKAFDGHPEAKHFRTPSGKLEIASPRFEARGAGRLPTFEPVPAHAKRGDQEFYFTTYQVNVHTHSTTAGCMALSEIYHSNFLLIHTEAARRLGIGFRDLVEVKSKVGSLRVPARPTEGIHPDVVALSDGVGHWAMGRIAQGQAFSSPNPETRLVWWGKRDGIGTHPNPIIPAERDPLSGRQCWMDTVVTVAKV
jgi:anaerobic selenocysteine-containing dehydrogenase